MFTPESSSSFERSHLSSSHPNIPVVRTNKLPSSHHPSPGSGQQPTSSHFTPYFDPTPGPSRPPVRQNLTDRYPSYEMPETVVLMPSTAQPACDEQQISPPTLPPRPQSPDISMSTSLNPLSYGAVGCCLCSIPLSSYGSAG